MFSLIFFRKYTNLKYKSNPILICIKKNDWNRQYRPSGNKSPNLRIELTTSESQQFFLLSLGKKSPLAGFELATSGCHKCLFLSCKKLTPLIYSVSQWTYAHETRPMSPARCPSMPMQRLETIGQNVWASIGNMQTDRQT